MRKCSKSDFEKVSLAKKWEDAVKMNEENSLLCPDVSMDDVAVTFPKMPFEIKVLTCNQNKSGSPCLTGQDFHDIASKQYFNSFMGMHKLDLSIYHRKAMSGYVRPMASFQPLTDRFE